jgi:hypothetical protein
MLDLFLLFAIIKYKQRFLHQVVKKIVGSVSNGKMHFFNKVLIYSFITIKYPAKNQKGDFL